MVGDVFFAQLRVHWRYFRWVLKWSYLGASRIKFKFIKRGLILPIFLISWIHSELSLLSLIYLKWYIVVISLRYLVVNFCWLYLFIRLQLSVFLYQIPPLLSYTRCLALQLPILLPIVKTNLQNSVFEGDTSDSLQLLLKFPIRQNTPGR